MNSKGDFYIGNLKKSSATGEETTYDTPVATITGQDASRLSAVFDEVNIKERLKVEGGPNGFLLSQFDGPVTFNKTTRFNETVDFSAGLVIGDETEAVNTTSGALKVSGGVGIGKSLYVDSLRLADDKKAYFGDDGDLEISHIGTKSYIKDTGTGSLRICSDDFRVYNAADDEYIIRAVQDTGVSLYDGANTVRLATNSSGVIVTGIMSATSDIVAYSTSDERLKDNVTPIDDPLAKVISISGNTFNWNSASQYEGKDDTGVIAQEVEKLDLPGVTTIRDDGTHAVRYEKLVPLLIEAIKELSVKVDNLEALAHPKPTGKTQKRNEDRLDALENKINN